MLSVRSSIGSGATDHKRASGCSNRWVSEICMKYGALTLIAFGRGMIAESTRADSFFTAAPLHRCPQCIVLRHTYGRSRATGRMVGVPRGHLDRGAKTAPRTNHA